MNENVCDGKCYRCGDLTCENNPKSLDYGISMESFFDVGDFSDYPDLDPFDDCDPF